MINILNTLLCYGQGSKQTNKQTTVVNSKERSQEYNLVF